MNWANILIKLFYSNGQEIFIVTTAQLETHQKHSDFTFQRVVMYFYKVIRDTI